MTVYLIISEWNCNLQTNEVFRIWKAQLGGIIEENLIELGEIIGKLRHDDLVRQGSRKMD